MYHLIFLHQTGTDEYVCRGGRGDFNLPGAPYQPLHSDLQGEYHTKKGKGENKGVWGVGKVMEGVSVG